MLRFPLEFAQVSTIEATLQYIDFKVAVLCYHIDKAVPAVDNGGLNHC